MNTAPSPTADPLNHAPAHSDTQQPPGALGSGHRRLVLTFTVAGGQHAFVCGAGTDVPDFTHLVEEDILVYDVVFVVKVYDVDLQIQREQAGQDLPWQSSDTGEGIWTSAVVLLLRQRCTVRTASLQRSSQRQA